ncbi:MAG: hypothetical protein QOD77_73 [Thermoplasmata archaeon]|nr:hypothetical protein [Thermoplasmata archaeon]
MQEGIGRGGYRLLATVFAAIGVLGLVVTLYAFGKASTDGNPRTLFDWLGFGLSFVGLVAVYGLLLVVLARRDGAAAAVRAAEPPQPAGAPPLPVGRPLSFEFEPKAGGDEEHAIAVEEDVEEAPARGDPRPAIQRLPPVLPPNRNMQVDAKGWPQRKGPSGVTRGEQLAQRRGETIVPLARTDDGGVVMVPSPAPASSPRAAAMVVRKEPAAVLAKVAPPGGDPDFTPDGMARGKCGGCETILLAPQERPIHLRCPKCGKVTKLA